jgi:hypothetical protein
MRRQQLLWGGASTRRVLSRVRMPPQSSSCARARLVEEVAREGHEVERDLVAHLRRARRGGRRRVRRCGGPNGRSLHGWAPRAAKNGTARGARRAAPRTVTAGRCDGVTFRSSSE